MLSVLTRSPTPIDVIEAPTAMSGPTAPGDLAQALTRLKTAHVDAIIIARGGGARSDLAAWDSPIVAQVIAHCPIPVLTALGHANDRTDADLVAHSSYETPSAAAAAIVARAEASVATERAAAAEELAQFKLDRSRRRALWAVAEAVVAVLLLVLVLLL